MLRPGGDQEGDYLVRLIVEEQITVVTLIFPCSTCFWSSRSGAMSLGAAGRRGETLTRALQQRVFDRLSADDGYGPTEATIASTFLDLPARRRLAGGPDWSP